MRFARLHAECEAVPAGLEELAGAGELDFLQLDYVRPRVAPVEGRAPAELPEFAGGFAAALRPLVKTLFLEPKFRVIASAGWAATFQCIEGAVGALVAGGCGDLPVAAVRGSHVLPILESLRAEGVDLRHEETGAPWGELREPLLAADLQLGAGPLATALAENARVIVAGYFGGAAPATALSVADLGWSWTEVDRLAAAALAAQAAAWCDWQTNVENLSAEPWRPPRIELDKTGQFTVETASGGEAAALRLQQWLRSGPESGFFALDADVQVDASAVKWTSTGPRQISVEGAVGVKTDDCWRLEVLYQSGYAAEAMVEFAPVANLHLQRQIANIARAHLPPAGDAGGLLTVEELLPPSGVGWLHVAYQSKSRTACQSFVDQTVRLVSAHRPLMRLASGAPAVHVHCGRWPARVPRDAVDIAVETRLAREWI